MATLRDGIRYLRGGSLDRAFHCFEAAGERAQDPGIQSEALRRQADVRRRRAQWREALQLIEQALQIATEHALRDHIAAALNIKGTIHLQRGDFDGAIAVYREALDVEPGAHQRGLICQNLGTAYAQQGAHGGAADWYERSSTAFKTAGYPREQVLALINQGNVRLDQGDFAAAEGIFTGALRQIDEMPNGDAELQALVEINLAETLAHQEARLEQAFDLMLNAIGHFSVSENRPHRVACHRVFALITERQGYPELSVGALERGLELAQQIESAPEAAHFERELARLKGSEELKGNGETIPTTETRRAS